MKKILQQDVMDVVKTIEWGFPGIDRRDIFAHVRLDWPALHRLMARLEKQGVIGKCKRTHLFILKSKKLDMDLLSDCFSVEYAPEYWGDDRWMEEEEYLAWCEKEGIEPKI